MVSWILLSNEGLTMAACFQIAAKGTSSVMATQQLKHWLFPRTIIMKSEKPIPDLNIYIDLRALNTCSSCVPKARGT
jgi:hypothetical protein